MLGRLVAVGIVAVLAAGCGSTPPSATAPVTQQPTAPASASPSAAGELPDEPGDLAPGRYAPTAVLGVSFEVEEGWSSRTTANGWFELQREMGDDDVIVRIAMVGVESADAAARAVQATPGITVLASSDSRMSGLTGPNLELENATDDRIDLLPDPPGVIGLDPGQRMWLSVFDASDGVLAISVVSDTGMWDSALLAVEPFLELVVIAP